jgi:penicillin-binding protein 2
MEIALAASCDVYFYKTGLLMGPEPVAEWAGKFGLGKKTGIDLPGEAKGTIPSPAWKKKMAPLFHNPDSTWYPGDTANMVIGQGDVQCTPIQMAQVTSAIANGGTVYAPHIVKQATDSITQKVLYTAEPKVMNRLGLLPEQIQAIARGMRHCVAGPRGTAHLINLHGVTVAGKTGSAERHGGGKKESHAWFVCFAPYEHPQIAIAIFLESDGQNYHGGADAAPIARKMLAKYFHITEQTSSTDGSHFD